MEDYTGVLEAFEEFLAIRRDCLAGEHRDIARVLNSMALVYDSQSDFNRAAGLDFPPRGGWRAD